MKKSIISLLFACLIISCDSSTNEPGIIPQGIYKGKFSRTNMYGKYAQSNVTLTILGNKFFGESDSATYPAVCNGTYSINGNTIEFSNECIWTADFDWSFILNGEFEFSFQGETLELVKVSNGNTDRYDLIRQ